MRLICSICPVLLIVTGMIFLTGCSNFYHPTVIVTNTFPSDTANKYYLKKVGDISLQLDSVTLNIVQTVQYLNEENNENLLLLNEFSNAIYFYDLSTGLINKVLSFDKKKVGNLQGFSYMSKDSLWLFSYDSRSLCLFTPNDITKYHRKRLIDQDDKEIMAPYPYVSTMSPISIRQGSIWTSGLVSGETNMETSENRPGIISIDMNTFKMSYYVNYPEMYQKGNWGGGLTYRLPYYTMVGDSLIISFSASHELAVLNLKNGTEHSFFAGSKYSKEIVSFHSPKKRASSINKDAAWKWYLNSFSYEGVLYDKYRNVYYRFVRLPLENNCSADGINKKRVSVIILDSKMRYVGESLLDSRKIYIPGNSFVSISGLNIQTLTNNENEIVYEQYMPFEK